MDRRVVGQRAVRVYAAVLALGLVGGWFARGVIVSSDHTASVRIVEGWAYQAGTSGGIGCCGDSEDEAGGSGYSVEGVNWRDLSQPEPSWHHGGRSPECLGANVPTLIRMGVVDVRPMGQAPGGPRVTWLECL